MDSTAGAAQNLVSNIGQLLAEEYRQLRGVGGEVAELRDDLATMNALLRMQAEADEGAVDHFIREWMKQLRELAYDAEDCVDLYKLRIKCRRRDNLYAWIKHMFETLFPRRGLAAEIKVLRARAIAISERHARYGVNREALRRSPILSPPPVMAALSEYALRGANDSDQHHKFVGIGNQADTLVERMKASAEKERRIKVLSIVGFGGVGKTTLAMDLCRRLVEDFPFQAMVSVSQSFESSRDRKPLLKRVLQQVVKPKSDDGKGIMEENPLDGIDSWDENGLADKLKESLQNKRYLIVIDDVWTIRAWESIQCKLSLENNQDSRIIVTTRIETVAEACSPSTVNGHHIHHMEPLKLEDSKKLFLSRVYGKEDYSYPKELGDVMDNILKKCGGLPLAIVSIACVLATSPGSIDKWETVCRSIGSQMESNPTLEGMKHIVTLSYNHLPHELKGCMMYLSVFPEDYVINKDRLLSRWIAEGLVPEKRGMSVKEVAESYLEELASRNMIEPCFDYNGKIESCRVHDMLLEVMVSKSLESNFVNLLGGQYAGMSYDRIRRLSIQGDDHGLLNHPKKKILRRRRKKHSVEDSMDLEHVRSLSMFQLKGHKLLDLLDKFTLLRVLDLEGCEGITNNHLKIVCRMYLLKFLNLKDTNISEVPSQVGNLEHLQTFDVRSTKLVGLPETMTNLEKLERVKFRNKAQWNFMWELPQGLSKMKELREVFFAYLKNDAQVGRELGELQQLQSIGFYVECPNDNAEVIPELVKSLSKLCSLRRLDISSIDTGKGNISFLHNIPTPPRLLRYLRIEGPVLNGGLPSWIGSLIYLVEFSIMRVGLTNDQLFGVLCKLPNLKCIRMEELCYKSDELIALTSQNFPVLSHLEVNCHWHAEPKVIRFEKGSMAKLDKFRVKFALERSIEGIEHLTNLKEVELRGNRYNPWLLDALKQLKEENRRRVESKHDQFQVVVKYD